MDNETSNNTPIDITPKKESTETNENEAVDEKLKTFWKRPGSEFLGGIVVRLVPLFGTLIALGLYYYFKKDQKRLYPVLNNLVFDSLLSIAFVIFSMFVTLSSKLVPVFNSPVTFISFASFIVMNFIFVLLAVNFFRIRREKEPILLPDLGATDILIEYTKKAVQYITK